MRQGYTVVSSGWDVTVAPGGGRQTITVPVAKNPDGSSIVGPALEEFAFDNATTMTGGLTYPTATLDKSQASLTVRVHYTDHARVRSRPPDGNMRRPDDQAVALGDTIRAEQAVRVHISREGSESSRAWASRPSVMSPHFCIARRWTSEGNPNPLAGDVQFVYSFCNSQACRFMHDFLQLGFNEDEHGQRVFDGMLNWAGGASGGFFNYRFAQPGRNHWQHTGRWYPERQFPFTNKILFDPITGKTDGRLRQCRSTNTCPKIFEIGSENEYWTKGGSLLHTDTLGNDLDDPENVRMYLLSSLPHVAMSGPGICQQPRNPLVPNRALRALLRGAGRVGLRGQDATSRAACHSASDGTLVRSRPQKRVGFPDIPGVTFNGLMTTGDLFDYGSSFDEGILTTLPPYLVDSPYPVFVPRTDDDGNDIAGIRLPEIAVPLATYTGWGLRAAAFAGDDLCDMAGQKIDFRQTKADRLAVGDPRLSIEERYPTHKKYVREVTRAAIRLYRQRLLLDEDVSATSERQRRATSANRASPF